MFERIDIFGKPVAFKFNGKEKAKSYIGATLTILFGCFVIWSGFQFGQDIIHKKNPKTITSESFAENPEQILISPDTFAFAFGLQDPNTFAHYINESIYSVQVTHTQLVRQIKEDGTVEQLWTSTPLEVEICTTEHFGKLGEKFANIELNQLFCLKKDQPALQEIRIQGVFESPLYEFVAAAFTQCKETPTSAIKCGTDEEIKALLGGGFFATYYNNIAIDPKNYSSPTIEYRDSYYTTISNTYFKELTLWLSHVKIRSDIGWLLHQNEINNYAKFDFAREMIDFRPDPETFLNFVVRVGKITTYYERSYTKIQDVFAEVEGITTAGLIVVIFFLKPYSNMKFYANLINELFDVKSLKDYYKKKSSKGKDNKRQRSLDKKGSIAKLKSLTEKQKIEIQVDSSKTNTFIEKKSPNDSQNISNFLLKETPKEMELSNMTRQNQPLQEKTLPRKKSFISSIDNLNNQSIELDIKNNKNNKASHQARFVQKLNDDSDSDNTPGSYKETRENRIDSNRPPAVSSFSSRSARMSTFRSHLLHDKPSNSKPQVKILENYDAQGDDEFNAVLESLILDKKEEKPRTSQTLRDVKKINEEKEERSLADILNYENESEVESNKKPPVKTNKKQTDEEEIIEKAQQLPEKLVKDSDKIGISFWEYCKSYVWKSQDLKEKMSILQEGVRRIDERLDIFNVLKKLREVDKLKLLLLENEQLVLFDTLPKPELSVRDEELRKSKSLTTSNLKETKFISEKRKNGLIAVSYENLKSKEKKTMIDERLLEIYDDIIES